jgi:prevent-host-death family protein
MNLHTLKTHADNHRHCAPQTQKAQFVRNHGQMRVQSRTVHHERFIITRRNKPVAALVSIEDLRIIEQHEERAGLAGIAGKWPEFDEVATSMGDIAELRRAGGGDRNVSL